MTDKRGPSDPGAGRRRPAPTIDLTATEVASDPVKTEQAVDPTPETPKPEPAAEPPKQRPDWLNVGSLRERLSASRASLSTRSSAPLIAAGAAGAAVTFLVFLMAWALGAFSHRDDLSVTLAARLAIMELQVRDLANRPQPAGLDQRAFADLAARIGAAEQAIAAPRPPATDPALAERLAAAENAVRAAHSRADEALQIATKSAANTPKSPVEHGEFDAIAKRVAALEQAAKNLEQRLARPLSTATDQGARVAFAAVALRAAVERGEPFAGELALAKALSPDAAGALAPLEPFAATGVPSNAALAREPAPANGPAREGGILERLQANAEKLVRIRPVNETPSEDSANAGKRADVNAALAAARRFAETALAALKTQ